VSIERCGACQGDGFVYETCGCREAICPHTPMRGDGTEPAAGIYHKFWVRRTDGSSRDGGKHAACDYFVLDWEHDKFAPAAALAYADACASESPDLALDLRARVQECRSRLGRVAPARETAEERAARIAACPHDAPLIRESCFPGVPVDQAIQILFWCPKCLGDSSVAGRIGSDEELRRMLA
jgi:hypothetical protein